MTLKYLRTFFVSLLAAQAMAASSSAVLVIAGVTDGDLSGGNPKAVILQAAAPVADLSMWGIGSANNGGGTDGQEFTLPAGAFDTDDVIVIAGNTDSFNFFNDNFVLNFTLVQSGAASVNGDDAIELFNNGSVFDVYGDPDSSTGTWTYANGFASRTGMGVGAFDQANYSTNAGAFSGLTEQQHIDIFVAAGFTPIPEPGTGILALTACGLMGLRRKRRNR